jgi:hypothetical protein
MADIFISYSHEDSATARLLTDTLQAHGLSVWLDRDSLVAGEHWDQKIHQELSKAETIVVLLSKHSSRNTWVQAEIRSALEKGHRIIPILLDEDAKNNWVWPLISDRVPIRIHSPSDIGEVARLLMPQPRSSASTRWTTLLIGVASAIVGAIVALLAS